MGQAWSPPAAGDITIAHLSDLHLGCPGTGESWALVSNFLKDKVRPALVLVSGDLVDTPDPALYQDAQAKLAALGAPVFVCAGNHDRHARGNRLRRWLTPREWFGGPRHTDALLDKTFAGLILLPHESRTIAIGTPDNTWSIGLMGVDSSTEADWSARGYVPSKHFEIIREQTKGKEWDLCIFAVHHHLISVQRLESARQKKLTDLANLTCLVNSGSLLEVLADSRVDLVLHGHEHMHNWGMYGTLAGSRGRVRVIGAGSATGNETLAGGAESRISFNLIVLSPRKTGVLKRVVRGATEWEVADEVRLFNAIDVRQSWLRRKYPAVELDRELVKYVQLTRERDVLVRWLFNGWVVDKPTFTHPVTSWNGELDRASLQACVRTQDGFEVVLRHPELRVAKPQAQGPRYQLEFDVPPSHRDKPVTVELSYRWAGAATLTEAEVEALQQEGKDVEPLRQSGYEFSTVWAPGPLASAELVISVPVEYAPQEVDVRVTQDPGGGRCPSEEAELRPAIRVLARGSYSLRIPYPRTGRDYTLVWKPIPDAAIPGGPQDPRYQSRVRELAEPLLEAFSGPLTGTELDGSASAALYVQLPNQTIIERVGWRDILAPVAGRAQPQIHYNLNRLSVLSLAWRGVLLEVRGRPETAQQALELGFADNETGLICLPLRFSFGWTNPPPLACVRIGVFGGRAQELLVSGNDARLWQLLSAGSTALLSRLFREV